MANHAPARRMSLENAELAKISVNTFVTMKITFANMLAALCEAIPGGTWTWSRTRLDWIAGSARAT